MTKPFHLGHAASAAVKAVWLARNGFSADQDIFDRAGGFLKVYGQDDGEPLIDLIETLRSPWELVTPGLYTKGWPCCYCNHRPVGGLFKLMAEHNFSSADVKEIKVGFLPGADQPLIKDNPQTGLEGKFSIEYAAAAALVDGFLDLSSFTDTAVQRPPVRAVMKRVSRFRIPSDKMFSGVAGFIELAVKTDNATYELRVETMPGSLAWPLLENQKESKFKSCVSQALSHEATDRLFELAMNLSGTANVRSLSDATVPRTQ